MFQNISKNTEDVFDEDVEFATEGNNKKIIQILTNYLIYQTMNL